MRALESDRLLLEPLVEAHAAELFAALSDPALYRFMEEAPPVSLQALADRYARLETRRSGDGREQWLNWVAREKASGKALGYVQATVLEDHSAWVAYVIAPPVQGKGFGREATAAMISELHSTYGAKRLRAGVDVRNAASIALLEALGFALAGRERGDALYERD